MKGLETRGKEFIVDGAPVRIISGAIHYFRVVPEYWEDRLRKLKACGFNTVETYVAWNIHEPRKGEFVFEGMADLASFIETAGKLGLYVIVRPSPYICAEWEFGGLPAWLLKDPGMRLRCDYKPFLDHVDSYYDVLLPKLASLQRSNGGPIIAMQIENEYGSYGNDQRYLNHLKEAMTSRGIDVLLFTSDGPGDFMLQGGMVPGVLETVNFGSRVTEAFAKLGEYQQELPDMCMEFWNGWFDHWGESHHTRDAAEAAGVFGQMLEAGASVNFYMFHGGTNFGFYNGANCGEDGYAPTTTSYDYDSAISECGDLTDKFYAYRETLAKYVDLPELVLPEPIAKKNYGQVALTERVTLFDALSSLSVPVESSVPLTMEQLDQDYGFILYTTEVTGPRGASELVLQEVRDRALIFVNGEYQGIIDRVQHKQPIKLAIPPEGAKLQILVENMGRINYGPFMKDPKGITEGVRLGNQFLYGWTIHALPLSDLEPLNFAEEAGNASPGTPEAAADAGGMKVSGKDTPAFYRGTFHVGETADTFLNFAGWTKGVAFVNGHNLGRYWEIGPQTTLYIPAPFLKQGSNEIVLFELHHGQNTFITLQDHADLG
ncbi:beta-galactosidase [Paenibacillus sp. HJL G12]|uniref:Beta-galactosidase n=1 Tax=Paenibacillus dendrobii TaxID=2691084 RepID=A0A7X3ILE2_9BACL|nr:glycoside hydrolase family 35 protein [Paenibacillus dendrobii]MWV46079.1 beta-galactosidase [Paenibacillus dendrobii]